VARSAFHWHPVRSTKKMASIALRLSTRGLWQPSGCGLPGGTSGSMRAHISSGIPQYRGSATPLVRFVASIVTLAAPWFTSIMVYSLRLVG